MYKSFLSILALSLSIPLSAQGGVHDVEMLNVSPDTNERMVFAPDLLVVDVGDVVTWRAVDRGHNVEFVRNAIPDGVKPFRSGFNKDVSYTFETEGVYVYKCTPHLGMGMVGVVVVGETADFGVIDALRLPKRAKERVQAAADQYAESRVAEMGPESPDLSTVDGSAASEAGPDRS